jgi:hypothetical protein
MLSKGLLRRAKPEHGEKGKLSISSFDFAQGDKKIETKKENL